jgi:hypothetical protein
MRKRSRKDVGKELHSYRKEYEKIRARILKIGFICKGSISERRIACGTPTCACHKDPQKRHGPYYQLSWKEKGKTLSHFLPPECVALYQEWIQNRQTIMDLIDQLEAVSRRAGERIRAAENRKSSARRKPKKGKKATKKRK